MCILIENAQFSLGKRVLTVPALAIAPRQFWAVVGGNGSGKTAFARMLSNELPLASGRFQHDFCNVARSSFEQQQQLLEAIFKQRNNDCVSPDDFGLNARQFILNNQGNDALCEQFAQELGISHLLDRPMIQLSTGESRKVFLCQTLVSQPDLLILDEPFEGLDVQSVQMWLGLFERLATQTNIVLIVNRLSDIPDFATHLALLDHLECVAQGERTAMMQDLVFQQLIKAEQQVAVALPSPTAPLGERAWQNPFELRNVTVQYGEQKILDNLSWTVRPAEHWAIKGPNGAGKSTLLSLLTGDHPQAYANHVVLFGRQRGSGETIWQIKQHIGYVSSQLHMDYRVNCSARDVIISGFMDSIGVYQKVPESLRIKADEWLARIGLTAFARTPFRSLSWGQQRLLLITRAMVKHPPVLILDEPLQGLDGLNRQLVKQFISQLVRHSQTQLLFVSHQWQDLPDCITHLFEFVPTDGGYCYRQGELVRS